MTRRGPVRICARQAADGTRSPAHEPWTRRRPRPHLHRSRCWGSLGCGCTRCRSGTPSGCCWSMARRRAVARELREHRTSRFSRPKWSSRGSRPFRAPDHAHVGDEFRVAVWAEADVMQMFKSMPTRPVRRVRRHAGPAARPASRRGPRWPARALPPRSTRNSCGLRAQIRSKTSRRKWRRSTSATSCSGGSPRSAAWQATSRSPAALVRRWVG